MDSSEDLLVTYLRIVFVEAAYWIVSIGTVFVNEFVLNSQKLTKDLTVFITAFQILFTLGILVSLNYINKACFRDTSTQPLIHKFSTAQHHLPINSNNDNQHLLHNDENDDDHENENPRVNQARERNESLSHLIYVDVPKRINVETCKLVFPLSILHIGMLLLNNYCLEYVGVAFYFVSRSLTTVFNVIFTYLLMKEPVSIGALTCCGLIIFGFVLGVDQENIVGNLSLVGVGFGIASSLFTSLFSIYTKKTLDKVDKNIWTLILYNSVNDLAICMPLLLVHGDLQNLVSNQVINTSFWFLLSISGVMSFFISIVTNASIKYTSPLTHNISGTAKACFQTVLAVIYNCETKSSLWWLSNIVILIASAAYSRIKQLEMELKRTKATEQQIDMTQDQLIRKV